MRQKAPSLPSLASIGSTSSRKKKIKDDLTMKRRISISRRKYIKEKSLIVTLVFITVMFTISTIPSGIVIIVRQFDLDNHLMSNGIFLVKLSIFRLKITLFLGFRVSESSPTCWNYATPQLTFTCTVYAIVTFVTTYAKCSLVPLAKREEKVKAVLAFEVIHQFIDAVLATILTPRGEWLFLSNPPWHSCM